VEAKQKEAEKIRLDKFLWAIRVYKTRTLAASACNRGKVKLGEGLVKPSHVVKPGETYHIKIDADFTRIIEVKQVLDKRQSFSVVKDYFVEHSPPREKKERGVDAFILPQAKREKGSGRPTKKDRRNLGRTGFFS
jgi:ribosome-associated heat shock protein Hsp15